MTDRKLATLFVVAAVVAAAASGGATFALLSDTESLGFDVAANMATDTDPTTLAVPVPSPPGLDDCEPGGPYDIANGGDASTAATVDDQSTTNDSAGNETTPSVPTSVPNGNETVACPPPEDRDGEEVTENDDNETFPVSTDNGTANETTDNSTGDDTTDNSTGVDTTGNSTVVDTTDNSTGDDTTDNSTGDGTGDDTTGDDTGGDDETDDDTVESEDKASEPSETG